MEVRGGAGSGKTWLAVEQHFAHHAEQFTKIGRERGWGPFTREAYDSMLGREGALFVGSPDTVAGKIAWAMRTLGLSRFQLKYTVGAQANADRMSSVRLYAEEVGGAAVLRHLRG